MAAYFTVNNGQEIQVHINEKFSFRLDEIQMIVEVQLDGHELEYVQREMPGIPTHKSKRVQKFYGDHAKFIVGSW